MCNDEAVELLRKHKMAKSIFDMETEEINYNSALNIAINSINRLIPQKVQKNDMTLEEEEYLCPNCEEVIEEYYTKPCFCNNKSCGQALKW